MELFKKNHRIFKNKRVLSPLFVPEVLQDRDKEIKEIAYYLGDVVDRATPSNLLVLGLPGSGKTVCLNFVLDKLNERTDVLARYVVADGTAYQVITDIARSCELDVPLRGLGFMEVWKILKEKVQDNISVFLLDEIDKCLTKDGSKLLYHLSRHANICTVAISNKLTLMNLIDDPRVLSSFNPKKIVFSPYNAEQLIDILEYRAERAFYPDVLDDAVIPLCSAMAAQRNGDARYALDLLAFSADICTRREKEKVFEEDVRIAKDEVEIEFIRRSITGLGRVQKILLFSVLNSSNNTPTQIYKYYNDIAENFGAYRLTQSRLSELLKELELFGLVEIERKGRGRGKGVDWSVSLSPTILKEIVMEALNRSMY